MRKPLEKWQPHERAGGPHNGTQVVNVHSTIARACFDGERINDDLYVKLHTEIDLDGLYDILEMQDVHRSWQHAELKNAHWRKQNL